MWAGPWSLPAASRNSSIQRRTGSTSWVDLSATDSPTPFQKFVIQLRLVGFAEAFGLGRLGLVCLRQPILSRLEALQSWNRCAESGVPPFGMANWLLQQVDLAEQSVDEPGDPVVAITADRPIIDHQERRDGDGIHGFPRGHEVGIFRAGEGGRKIQVLNCLLERDGDEMESAFLVLDVPEQGRNFSDRTEPRVAVSVEHLLEGGNVIRLGIDIRGDSQSIEEVTQGRVRQIAWGIHLFSSQVADRSDLFARQDMEIGVEDFGDIVYPVFEIRDAILGLHELHGVG